jgi:CDP-glucose 4,6-dehydratase
MARPAQAIIVASSDKAYGPSERLPYTEDHPLAGRSIYDASKSACDLISSAYASSFGLPIAIIRCANLYGGGDLNWERIVPGTIRSLLGNQPPVIRSDGTLRRDYLFVDDAVDGYLAVAGAVLAGHVRGEAFNLGNGVAVSVFEMVAAIRAAVGDAGLEPIIEGHAPNEIAAQWLDSRKARDLLGWTPRFSLLAGVCETVPWYRDLLQ